MPELKNITNLEQTKKDVAELAQKITDDFTAYLGPKNDELKSCPICTAEFDPIEVGIEEKSIEDFWTKQGDKNFKDLTERISVQILAIIQKIDIKPRDGETEIAKKLQEMGVVIQALRDITKIMATFKGIYQKLKDEETANDTMFKALSDIDKVLSSVYQKPPKP
jgi:hypothetical protein